MARAREASVCWRLRDGVPNCRAAAPLRPSPDVAPRPDVAAALAQAAGAEPARAEPPAEPPAEAAAEPQARAGRAVEAELVAAQRRRRQPRRQVRPTGQSTRGEDVAENERQILGSAVLDVVDVEARDRLVADIEALDPGPGAVEEGRLVGDHQHRIHPLDRHEADDIGEGALLLAAEDGLQLAHDGLRLARLQREDAEGLTRQPVDVEGVDHVDHVDEVVLAAAEDENVAGGVRPQHGALRRQRLKQLLHLGGADEAQRHHHHAGAGPSLHRLERAAQAGAAANGLIGRDDAIEPLRLHERRPVEVQDRLQGREQGCGGHRLAGLQRNRALHPGVDDVVVAEGVAEDRLDHLLEIGVDEVERDLAFGGGAADAVALARPPGDDVATRVEAGRLPGLRRLVRQHRTRAGGEVAPRRRLSSVGPAERVARRHRLRCSTAGEGDQHRQHRRQRQSLSREQQSHQEAGGGRPRPCPCPCPPRALGANPRPQPRRSFVLVLIATAF